MLLRRVLGIAAAIGCVLLAVGGPGALPATAATGATGLITITPPTQSHPSGGPQTYTISLSCQGTVGAECGPDGVVTIPLDTTTTPAMTDPSWTFTATSLPGTLITAGPTVVGDNLVIDLNNADTVAGGSGTITLVVTPPNDITPNDTSWSMTPTFSGDNMTPVVAPTPAQSTATASPLPVITKATADGGSVYTAGSPVTYTINATCSNAATGNLEFETGSLSDTIPAGMTYVSSTPVGTVSGNTITWDFPDAASTPAGCAPGATGPTTFQVTLLAPDPAPADQPLTNTATFAGTGADATNPAGIEKSTSASVPIQVVDEPSSGPGPGYATIAKTSLAPLGQQGVSGNQYIATYPGDWLPVSSSPSYTVGAAAASYQVTVHYGLVGAYQTQLLDPEPCLDNPSGSNTFNSADYAGAACAHPAFHLQILQVYLPSYGDGTGLGAAANQAPAWTPQAILTDGTTIGLQPTSPVGGGASSAYYAVPAGDDVATVVLPPNPALEGNTLQLTQWGYADLSLGSVNQSINDLHDIATAIPQLPGPLGRLQPQAPVQAAADIVTVPDNLQLGIAKSFGPTGGASGGGTTVNITGAVNYPTQRLPYDVVLTDLLPTGMTWTNPQATIPVTLQQGGGQSTVAATATVQDLTNYQGSGRELIRLTVPAASFTGPGSWTITPASGSIVVTTPTALGVYTNTDQIFLYGLGATQIDPNCTTPTQTGGGTSTATFESDNDQDLTGDGNVNEDYCQNSASLSITGTGAAFALTKTVQGNLDTIPRGAGGIGTASEGGSGVYTLTWTNVGSDDLDDPVIYDILPYVGDTGITQGQSTVPRDSAFQPIFAGVGALPAGVAVEYSTSTNPCRDEVYPDAANPTCVDAWTTTEPADPATVAALRYTSSNTYSAGQSFAVSFAVTLPPDVVNQVAWNAAATNAGDASNPSIVPVPAEPPKVGITAPSTPTLATSASDTTVPPHTAITDSVTISGSGGQAGALAWSLVGPVAPVNGSCSGASWAGADTAGSGTTPTTGDGTFVTGPVTVNDPGCYSWVDTLTPATQGAFPLPPPTAAGTLGEVTQVALRAPAISTQITSTPAGEGLSVSDTVVISNTGLSSSPGAPTSAVLTWTLYGPVAAQNGACTGLTWSGAPVAGQGTLTITEDGTYDTPATTITAAGCYTFTDAIAATQDSVAVSTDPGLSTETVQLPEPGGLAPTGLGWPPLVGGGLGLLLLGAFGVSLSRRRRFPFRAP